MRNTTDTLLYIATLLITDLFIFFVIYMLHSLIFKDFPIIEAAATGVYALIWRVISLQIIIQVLFMLMLSFFNTHKSLVFLVFMGIISVVSAVALSYSSSQIPSLLIFPNKEAVGEGYAVILSITMTWIIMKKLKILND